jgi:hypothetical protein
MRDLHLTRHEQASDNAFDVDRPPAVRESNGQIFRQSACRIFLGRHRRLYGRGLSNSCTQVVSASPECVRVVLVSVAYGALVIGPRPSGGLTSAFSPRRPMLGIDPTS